MVESKRYTYKVADSSEEFEQIHRLNYDTFVSEIPQHTASESERLVDRFHDENTYIIAKDDAAIIAMIAVRGRRPFSLDEKLSDMDAHLPVSGQPCEVRLLAIEPAYRGGTVFYGLCKQLIAYCLDQGYTMAVISGTPRQAKLYKHLGFKPFGPEVGTDEAPYQPMYLTRHNFEQSASVFKKLLNRQGSSVTHNFLPGPVTVGSEVSAAWAKQPLSHRSGAFETLLTSVRDHLCTLTNANHAVLAVGTGTLANDMVAAQLTKLSGKGLILSNGEFGDRLIDHATRWGLDFQTVESEWSHPISYNTVSEVLAAYDDIEWLWTVHCETSTGYLYDLDQLKTMCRHHGVKLCVDACSSLGVVSVDLEGVFLASSVSGKGLASYPGLAIVLSQEQMAPSNHIPRYMDLGLYQIGKGVPYTHVSNEVHALKAALEHPLPPVDEVAASIKRRFSDAGMKVLDGAAYSPAIITVALPPAMSSRALGDELKQNGITVSYESSYLLENNWFQLALMGMQSETGALTAAETIKRVFKRHDRQIGGT